MVAKKDWPKPIEVKSTIICSKLQ